MFQCIEVIGISDITDIYNDQQYKINIYFTNGVEPVWSTGIMAGKEIVNLNNGGVRIEFTK